MSKYDLEYEVDLWKTGAHGVEVGIKKEAELRSKSRQFTKDSDIIGEVRRGDKEAGYIVFREEPWKQELPNKHVILKYFTKSITWKASLEQLVARTLMQSVAGDLALPAFMVNVSNTEYLVTLEKIKRKPKLGKSSYAFHLIDDEYNVYTYAIETDRLSIGSDWFVYDDQHEKIAEIDGAKFNIGGKYTIKINSKSENYQSGLDTVLILFASLNKYLEEIEADLEKSVKEIKKGKIRGKISKEEAMLYLNPRRIKM
ncbi:MAG: hypothetical protein INQ03_14965 [Candidatus Heimdallarchaeota archaeon]|nr:hypothetical protein [Candidatus Heimdallarchaeota archaeon]